MWKKFLHVCESVAFLFACTIYIDGAAVDSTRWGSLRRSNYVHVHVCMERDALRVRVCVYFVSQLCVSLVRSEKDTAD